MCEHHVYVPIPDHMPEALASFDIDHPEYGVNDEGRESFAIDACIAPALLAVWAAGFRTLGCCCGHGQDAGGIITIDTGTYSATPRTGTRERFAAIHDGHPDPAKTEASMTDPSLLLCACGHEARAHLDLAGSCDGSQYCDCTCFIAQADARKFGGMIEPPGPAGGSEGQQPVLSDEMLARTRTFMALTVAIPPDDGPDPDCGL